jgi:hypothetical protein
MLRTKQLDGTLRCAFLIALMSRSLAAAHLLAQGVTYQRQSTLPWSSVTVSTVLGNQTTYLGSVPAGKSEASRG